MSAAGGPNITPLSDETGDNEPDPPLRRKRTSQYVDEVIPRSAQPGWFQQFIGSAWLRTILAMAMVAGVVASVVGDLKNPVVFWATLIAAGATALGELADHATRGRLQHARNRGTRLTLESARDNLNELRRSVATSSNLRSYPEFRRAVVRSAHSAVLSAGLTQARVCLYDAPDGEGDSSTTNDTPPRITRLDFFHYVGGEPPRMQFNRGHPDSEGMFETVDELKSFAVKRKGREKKRHWITAVRVPVLVENQCVGVLTVDSMRRRWMSDPTYARILEYSASLLATGRELVDSGNNPTQLSVNLVDAYRGNLQLQIEDEEDGR